MKICDLRQCADVSGTAELLAQWFVDGFADEGAKYDEELAWLQKSILEPGALPVTLVALESGEPVGTARLFLDEMPDRSQYNPWFGYAYVVPSRRGNVILPRLYRAMCEYCVGSGVAEAYFYTRRSERPYEAMGWRLLEKRQWLGHSVSVMSMPLLKPSQCP